MTSAREVLHFLYLTGPASIILAVSISCSLAASSRHAMAMVGVLCFSGASVLYKSIFKLHAVFATFF
jgi:hypothetical protein